MRFLLGFFGASLVSAIVAALWVAVLGGDQAIAQSFGVPDLIGSFSPSLAVALRHLLTFIAGSDITVVILFDVLVGLPLFAALELGGVILFSVIDAAWRGEGSWDKPKPLWGALIFAVVAVIVVFGSRKYGLPPFAQLRVQPLGLMLAASVGGALYGLGRLMLAAADEE